MSKMFSAIFSLSAAFFTLLLNLITWAVKSIANQVAKQPPLAPPKQNIQLKQASATPPTQSVGQGATTASQSREPAPILSSRRIFTPVPKFGLELLAPYMLYSLSEKHFIGETTIIAMHQRAAFGTNTSLPWRRFLYEANDEGHVTPMAFYTTGQVTIYGYDPAWFATGKGQLQMPHSPLIIPFKKTAEADADYLARAGDIYHHHRQALKDAANGNRPNVIALRPKIAEEAPPEPPEAMDDFPDEDGMIWVVTSHSRKRLPPSRFLLAPPLRALPKPSVVTA